MADLRWITSDADLPTDRQYVLIAYGENNGLLLHSAGLTYSIDCGRYAKLTRSTSSNCNIGGTNTSRF